MEVTKKPKIKSIPYEEFTDNETLEKLVRELNAGGANVALGVLDDFVNWGRSNSMSWWDLLMNLSIGGVLIRFGLLRLQPAVAVSNSWPSAQPATIWRASGSR